jgi:hypothetical protein
MALDQMVPAPVSNSIEFTDIPEGAQFSRAGPPESGSSPALLAVPPQNAPPVLV